MAIAAPNLRAIVPAGGLDQTTAPLLLKEGAARDAMNFEVAIEGGYARSQGYERYVNGRAISALAYYTARIDSVGGLLAASYNVVGEQSRARATVINAVDPDHWDDAILPFSTDLDVYLANVSGRFVSGERLLAATRDWNTGAIIRGTLLTVPTPVTGASSRLQAQAIKAAQDARRATMRSPGGILKSEAALNRLPYMGGPVKGVARLNGNTFVWRRRAAETPSAPQNILACVRDTPDSGASSGAGGVDWTPITQWEQSQQPAEGAHVRCVVHNFFGQAQSSRLYGVTGTGPAFHMGDDGVPSFILLGLDNERPAHVAVHKNRLVLAQGSSLFLSQAGLPTDFDTALGAAEIACGSDIQDLIEMQGDGASSALVIITTNSVRVLYGDGESNWDLRAYEANYGGVPFTAQRMGTAFFANDLGVTSLSGTADNWGSFKSAVITQAIDPFMATKRRQAVCSMICRAKNQYRIYFRDGDAVHITMTGSKIAGMFPQRLRMKPTCAWSEVSPSGEEIMLVGAQDGFIYRMDSGNNHDGRPMVFWLLLAFAYCGSPRTLKSFRQTTLEIQGNGYADFQYGYDLQYTDPQTPTALPQHVDDATLADDYTWDGEGQWDTFRYWDTLNLQPITFYTPGDGENYSGRISGRSDICAPIRLTGVLLTYFQRRQNRS